MSFLYYLINMMWFGYNVSNNHINKTSQNRITAPKDAENTLHSEKNRVKLTIQESDTLS